VECVQESQEDADEERGALPKMIGALPQSQVRPGPVNVSADSVQESACEPEEVPVSGFEHKKGRSTAKRDTTSPRSGASIRTVLKARN
jgi:hypothetical protein